MKQRQLKSQLRLKRKAEIVSVSLSSKVLSLRLIVMSTNLEYRARERQRKRESERQASEAQRRKGRQGFIQTECGVTKRIMVRNGVEYLVCFWYVPLYTLHVCQRTFHDPVTGLVIYFD